MYPMNRKPIDQSRFHVGDILTVFSLLERPENWRIDRIDCQGVWLRKTTNITAIHYQEHPTWTWATLQFALEEMQTKGGKHAWRHIPSALGLPHGA